MYNSFQSIDVGQTIKKKKEGACVCFVYVNTTRVQVVCVTLQGSERKCLLSDELMEKNLFWKHKPFLRSETDLI